MWKNVVDLPWSEGGPSRGSNCGSGLTFFFLFITSLYLCESIAWKKKPENEDKLLFVAALKKNKKANRRCLSLPPSFLNVKSWEETSHHRQSYCSLEKPCKTHSSLYPVCELEMPMFLWVCRLVSLLCSWLCFPTGVCKRQLRF